MKKQLPRIQKVSEPVPVKTRVRISLSAPLFLLIILASFSIGIGSEYLVKSKQHPDSKKPSITASPNNTETTDIYSYFHVTRQNKNKLTQPVLLYDIDQESMKLQELKTQLQSTVAGFREKNILQSASIYVRDFSNSSWIDIDADEMFHPASLMKITVLIYYLKLSESDPGILNRQLMLSKDQKAPGQTFEEKNIRPGVPYTVNDLLERMIVNSDNYATSLLDYQIDDNALSDIFNKLNIPKPVRPFSNYMLSSRDYSKLMRILYNASYLNESNSEKALLLLTRSDFELGIKNGLPKNITVAHKFGEYSLLPNTKELHESAIVYAGNKTYLITIMTKGPDVKQLPQVLSTLSQQVHYYFSNTLPSKS